MSHQDLSNGYSDSTDADPYSLSLAGCYRAWKLVSFVVIRSMITLIKFFMKSYDDAVIRYGPRQIIEKDLIMHKEGASLTKGLIWSRMQISCILRGGPRSPKTNNQHILRSKYGLLF